MADTICSLNVENKKNVTRVIANSVLGPKKSGLIHFSSNDQVKHALRLQEDKEILIKSEIPSNIINDIENDKNDDSEYKGPVQQVKDAFNGYHPADTKNSEGWNSPNDAYAGRDLKNRDHQSEGSNDEGESTSQWNSPDDAYAGEDLKDRHDSEEESDEESEQDSEEQTNEEESSNEDTQEEDNSSEEEPAGEQPESEENNVEANEKPDWYLNYDEVENKTRAQLLEWAANVEGLNLSKSKTAKEVTEATHAFLASQFPEHQE